MVVIEWNAHLFASDVHRFPMYTRFTRERHADAPQAGQGGWTVPNPGAEPCGPADYAESLRLRGIDRCVVVHPEPCEAGHCWATVPRLRT
jgi:hypothetical protein